MGTPKVKKVVNKHLRTLMVGFVVLFTCFAVAPILDFLVTEDIFVLYYRFYPTSIVVLLVSLYLFIYYKIIPNLRF